MEYYGVMKIDFIQLETVPSTNTWAKENHSRFNPSHLTCITAKEQTGGRGRQQKKWISPKDSNLYTTLYFVVPEKAPYLSNLGQIMALACAELLIEMNLPAQLKWPNDLFLEKKKVGGVLTETVALNNSVGVVLGLGLNVNMPESILQTINQPVTSLHLFLKQEIAPNSLLEPLLRRFISNLVELRKSGFSSFQKPFNQLLYGKGGKITIQLPYEKIEGLCDSITSDGRLRVRLSNGELQSFSSGEIV